MAGDVGRQEREQLDKRSIKHGGLQACQLLVVNAQYGWQTDYIEAGQEDCLVVPVTLPQKRVPNNTWDYVEHGDQDSLAREEGAQDSKWTKVS